MTDATTHALVDEARASWRRHPHVRRAATVARAVQRQQSTEQVGLAASGAAFWLVISAFPAAAAMVNVFGLVVSPTEVADAVGNLASAAPSSLGALVTEQLTRAAAASRAGLSVGLAVSVLLAIWSASAGVYNLDRAIRFSFGLPGQRYTEARARSLVGAVAVVVVPGALALGAAVLRHHAPTWLLVTVGVPVLLVVLTLGILLMYRISIGPTAEVRRLVPGAITAAVCVVMSLVGFTGYLALSTRYAAVYGAFAGLVIGMVGSYLAVYAILIGAVLNAQLHRVHGTPGAGPFSAAGVTSR